MPARRTVEICDLRHVHRVGVGREIQFARVVAGDRERVHARYRRMYIPSHPGPVVVSPVLRALENSRIAPPRGVIGVITVIRQIRHRRTADTSPVFAKYVSLGDAVFKSDLLPVGHELAGHRSDPTDGSVDGHRIGLTECERRNCQLDRVGGGQSSLRDRPAAECVVARILSRNLDQRLGEDNPHGSRVRQFDERRTRNRYIGRRRQQTGELIAINRRNLVRILRQGRNSRVAKGCAGRSPYDHTVAVNHVVIHTAFPITSRRPTQIDLRSRNEGDQRRNTARSRRRSGIHDIVHQPGSTEI